MPQAQEAAPAVNASTPSPGYSTEPFDRLLTVQAVGERLSLSPRQVWRLCDSGKLPRPLSLGPRCKRWRTSDIDRFVREL